MRSSDDDPGRVVSRLRPPIAAMIRALVIVARADEDPVARPRGVNRGLNRAELPGDPVVGAHPKHLGPRMRSER